MTHAAEHDPPGREPGRAATRQALLAAAAEVIAEKGYEKATLAEIARRAGLTTGAVYSTYGSKWDLLQAVIEDMTTTNTARSELPADLPLPELTEQVAARLHAAVLGTNLTTLGALQFEAILLALRNPDLLETIRQAGLRRNAIGADNLARAAEANGHPFPLPAAQTALLADVLAQGLQLAQLITPDLVSEQLYRDAFRLVTGLPVSAAADRAEHRGR